MSDAERVSLRAAKLSAAQREWIRRQGITARMLAAERRRACAGRFTPTDAEVMQVREQLSRHDRRRLDAMTSPGRHLSH